MSEFIATIQLSGAMLLSYIFLTAGIHKIKNHDSFKGVIGDYELLPEAVVHPFVFALATLEILVGASLLVSFSLTLAAWSAIFLLSLYMTAISVTLIRGKRLVECGCGSLDAGQKVSGWLLVRNTFLLILAAGLLATPVIEGAIWLLVVPMAIFLIVFYLASDQLLMNKGRLDDLRLHHG